MHTALVISAYVLLVLAPCAIAQWGHVLMPDWRSRRALRRPKKLMQRRPSLHELVLSASTDVEVLPLKTGRLLPPPVTMEDQAERVAERLAALAELQKLVAQGALNIKREEAPRAAATPEKPACQKAVRPAVESAHEEEPLMPTRGAVPVARKRVVSPGEAMARAWTQTEARARAEAKAKAEAAAKARAEAEARRVAERQARAEKAAMLEAARISEARRQAAETAALLEARREREAEAARLKAEERSRMEMARLAAAAATLRELAARQAAMANARQSTGPQPGPVAVAPLPPRLSKAVYAQYGFDDDDPPSGPPTESSGEMSVAA